MSEIKKQKADGNTAAARVKKRNMLKKQRTATVFASLALLLLVAVLCTVLYLVGIYRFEDVDGNSYTVKKSDGAYALFGKNGEICGTTDFQNKKCYLTSYGTIVYVDPESGETEILAVVDTEGSEVQDFGATLMIFKEMTYDEDSVKDDSMIIDSIEIKNSNGGYTFKRKGDGFVITGNEDAPFSALSFAMLANSCGRPRASRWFSLPEGTDYTEYGLESEMRTRTETDENGNEKEVEYLYTPTVYTITAVNGDRHEVIVGDMTVTGSGFYAKYNGGEIYDGDNVKESPARDKVYVLSITEDILNGGADGYELLNGRIEAFITPRIVYPMELTNYFYVSNFSLRNNIDYDKIYAELDERFDEEDAASKEFLEEYEKLFLQYSHQVCDFSFYDFEQRTGGMNAYTPYISHIEYADGYQLNGDNMDLILEGFYQTEFLEVVKLSPNDDELAKYGLSDAPYVITFMFRTKNSDDEEVYVENFVDISLKTDDGGYYAYSPIYDMIVKVGESSFSFLEWDDTYWYDDSYFQMSISHVESLLIESPAFKTEFRIDDSASKYLGYVAQSHKKVTVNEKEYTVGKDGNGNYVLKYGDEIITPYYSGDYLLTPVICKQGVREADNYLFSEMSETDTDGDGTNDSIMYYFYNIVRSDGAFYLVAQIMLADYNGNQLTDVKTVSGTPVYESSYYLTTTGYMFFVNKDSSAGESIEEMFGSQKRGGWGIGRMFTTSKGKNILINSETGAWVEVDDVSCGLYLADSRNSRLARRAVEIPAKYDANGKLTRYSDIYYPMTTKKIAYLEEEDIIAAYDEINEEWRKITYSECTIGVWGECMYYVLDGGVTVMIDTATGDLGEVSILTNQTYVADIYSDGDMLSYTIDKDAYSASNRKVSAMQNFQELYKYLLNASVEGIAELGEDEKSELRGFDDFTSGSNEACVLKMTLKASDYKGNVREIVYRFYRYSERRAYLTIETVKDGEPSSEKAYGNFSVLYSFVRKVIEDAQKVVDGQTVYSTDKY